MKKLYWIGLFLGSWLVLQGSSCNHPAPPTPPSPPPPSPSPTPAPSAPPLTIQNGRFWRGGGAEFTFKGLSFCCDDPATPGVDEGYRDHWSLASKEAIDRAHARGVTFLHFRVGPYDTLAPVWPGAGLDILPALAEAVGYANSLGIVVEVGLVDFWTLASGHNLWGDQCRITQDPLPARYAEWVAAIVGAVGGKDVTWNVGNEAFRCLRSDTWEIAIMAKVREIEQAKGFSRHLFGTSWWLPDVRPDTNPDYIALQDVFFAPPSPMFGGKPVLLNEDDGLYHPPAQWQALIAEAQAHGGYVSYWPGIQSDAQVAFFYGGPDPGPRCIGAPEIERLEVGPRPASGVTLIDGTPKVCDRDWCAANGAPGQVCCAYGSEDEAGWTQRIICESEKGAPYRWSFEGKDCTPYAQPGADCWVNGNPLQVLITGGLSGTVTLCTKGGAGVCRSVAFVAPQAAAPKTLSPTSRRKPRR